MGLKVQGVNALTYFFFSGGGISFHFIIVFTRSIRLAVSALDKYAAAMDVKREKVVSQSSGLSSVCVAGLNVAKSGSSRTNVSGGTCARGGMILFRF